ncbi:LOW QUALITY PROTEIN: uncharacterized protein C4orf17 homolog [Morus bassanus]
MWKYNRCYSQSSCSGEKYYYSRNNPHPRMVCHIPGLNNAPVCVVRSSISKENPPAANASIPQQDQERVLTGKTTRNTSATCYLPKLNSFTRRELGTSQSVTQGLADVPRGIQNKPASSEKLLKASAQSANREGIHIPPLTQPPSPFVNLHRGPRIQENMNSHLSYLDQKIKVLEKLSKILQTDSLIEIQKWFAKAGEKEKDLVSSLIYSELTDKGMPNAKEENMKSLEWEKECLLLSTLRKGPAEADTLFPGKNATEKVLWKQEIILPLPSTRSLTCATATPKKQPPPFQWRLHYYRATEASPSHL